MFVAFDSRSFKYANPEFKAFKFYKNMEQLKIFSYENESISFKKINGSVYINATEMAKYFGKKPINFLKLESTIEFIAELNSEVTKNNFVDNQIIITNKGGDNGGGSSWFHEDIALEFAPKEIEQERCLQYVALSRAKQELIFCDE